MNDDKKTVFKRMKDQVELLHILMKDEDVDNEAQAVAFVEAMNHLMCMYIGSLLAFGITAEIDPESEALLRGILKKVGKDKDADRIIEQMRKAGKEQGIFNSIEAKLKTLAKPDLPPPRLPQEDEGDPFSFGM